MKDVLRYYLILETPFRRIAIHGNLNQENAETFRDELQKKSLAAGLKLSEMRYSYHPESSFPGGFSEINRSDGFRCFPSATPYMPKERNAQ